MPSRIRILPLPLTIALVLAAAQACARATAAAPPSTSPQQPAFDLAGELILTTKTDSAGLRLGGLSGLVALRDGHELLAISDDSESARVIRLRVTRGPEWKVEPVEAIRLGAGAGAPARLDPEGIALTAEGHILISSEGIASDGARLPPSILEYSPDGRFMRQLPVRPRYVPNPVGPLVTGVRPNAGFESLTTSPDFSRLFTATELALVQDGDGDPFSSAPRTRILEYFRTGGTYQPAREFAYELDPLPRPTYPVRFAVNGLVELLALNNSELLAMERGFIESEDKTAVINRIRIFRIELDRASDVSAVDGLSGAPSTSLVKKVLVADLNGLSGLSAKLSGLDNFEGLAWGPADDTGVRPLIVVSDDNFSGTQVTAFLFLQPGRAARAIR